MRVCRCVNTCAKVEGLHASEHSPYRPGQVAKHAAHLHHQLPHRVALLSKEVGVVGRQGSNELHLLHGRHIICDALQRRVDALAHGGFI